MIGKTRTFISYFCPFPCNYISTFSNLVKLLVQSPVFNTSIQSRYTRIYLKPWNSFFVFFENSEELHTPIGILLYLYLPHVNIIVQRIIPYVLSLIWKYPMFKYNYMAHLNPSVLSSISWGLGIG